MANNLKNTKCACFGLPENHQAQMRVFRITAAQWLSSLPRQSQRIDDACGDQSTKPRQTPPPQLHRCAMRMSSLKILFPRCARRPLGPAKGTQTAQHIAHVRNTDTANQNRQPYQIGGRNVRSILTAPLRQISALSNMGQIGQRTKRPSDAPLHRTKSGPLILSRIGPLRSHDPASRCCSAARRSRRSPRLQNRADGELVICGLLRHSFSRLR